MISNTQRVLHAGIRTSDVIDNTPSRGGSPRPHRPRYFGLLLLLKDHLLSYNEYMCVELEEEDGPAADIL